MDSCENDKVRQNVSNLGQRCEDILLATSELYYLMCVLDLEEQDCAIIKADERIAGCLTAPAPLQERLCMVMEQLASPEVLGAAQLFTTLSTLAVRFEGRRLITKVLHTNCFGWCNLTFVRLGTDPLTQVLLLVESVDKQVGRLEEQLLENRSLNERINTDSLSQVRSRSYYDEHLADQGCEAVVMADIDSFKSINDEQGHLCGDATLVAVGAALRSCVRATDDVARYGGDEFLVAFRTITQEALAQKLERMRAAVEQIHLDDYPDMHLSLSVGAAYGHGRVADMVEVADKALYASKGPKNEVTIWPYPLEEG